MAEREDHAMNRNQKIERHLPLNEHMSRRENGVPLSVYRSRTTRIILVILQIFGFVCLQAGSQLHVASLFPEAKLDLQLALLWTAFTGLSVVYVSILLWEAARFHFLHRGLGIGLQFAYGGMCILIGWVLPPPTSYVPLSLIVYIPLTVVAIWGSLMFCSFLLLLVWDARQGSSSRRLVDRRRRTPWDRFFTEMLLAGTPKQMVEMMLDAWYEVREIVKQDAQED